MKRVIGFMVVFFCLVLTVPLSASVSADAFRADNDVGFVMNISDDAVTIPVIAMEMEKPVYLGEAFSPLKVSMVAPAISHELRLETGQFSYDNSICAISCSDNRCCYIAYYSAYCQRTTIVTPTYRHIYEGLYRLDIGECLRQS